MRGTDDRTGTLFSYIDLEARVRKDHPLRTIRFLVNEALGALQEDFSALYSGLGRPSIPPERLLRAMLVQAFYSVRSGWAFTFAAAAYNLIRLPKLLATLP